MNDTTGDTTHGATDRATRHRVVSVNEAAIALGITPDSVRARLRRGSLSGEKVGPVWYVFLEGGAFDNIQGTPNRDLVDNVHEVDRIARHDATRDTTSRDTQPTIDLAPLVKLVDDLTRSNADLSAAAAMWQTRAAHLENELKQLTAGEIVSEPSPIAPESPESDDSATTGIRAWWRRLLGG